jgi:hypothetical protein
MTAEHTLTEVEQITQTMLDAAKRENWIELAGLEDKRRSVLAGIDGIALKSPKHQDALQRIVQCNDTIAQRLKDRRDDIGLLLDIFGEPTAKTDG